MIVVSVVITSMHKDLELNEHLAGSSSVSTILPLSTKGQVDLQEVHGAPSLIPGSEHMPVQVLTAPSSVHVWNYRPVDSSTVAAASPCCSLPG